MDFWRLSALEALLDDDGSFLFTAVFIPTVSFSFVFHVAPQPFPFFSSFGAFRLLRSFISLHFNPVLHDCCFHQTRLFHVTFQRIGVDGVALPYHDFLGFTFSLARYDAIAAFGVPWIRLMPAKNRCIYECRLGGFGRMVDICD